MIRPVMKTLFLGILGVAVLGFGVAARAQDKQEVRLRTVLVQDGKIFIDGRLVAAPPLPAPAAPTEEVGTLQVTWIGDESPIFPLRGKWFRVDEGRLVPQADIRLVREQADVHAEAEVVRSVEMARRVALETYVQGLREENRALFGRIHTEERMEFEAQSLAQQIRSLQPGAERQGLEGQLRSKLKEIVDLKHENRLAEIRELEQRLERLKESLRERERARDEVIDRRFEELVGRRP